MCFAAVDMFAVVAEEVCIVVAGQTADAVGVKKTAVETAAVAEKTAALAPSSAAPVLV